MKFYFISDLVIFVAITVQQIFFFLVYCVSTMKSYGENFVNSVWNEKSYSSIYIYIYFKYKNRDVLPESAPFLKRGRFPSQASPF
jgi:hypothetical protein